MPEAARRFPFPDHPRGWFQIALSDEVRPGVLTTRSYFGRELVAFRTADGAPHVTEAHCPHLGAHLGVGGRVEDDCVVCPFHGWRYDAAGRNVEIPYRPGETNGRARLRPFAARDWCGMVMVWFDDVREADVDEPDVDAPDDVEDSAGGHAAWALPDVPELHDERLLWHAPPEARWSIRTHPQEVLENAVDIAHFQFVHGVSSFGALSVEEQGPMLRSTAELALTTPKGPVAGAVVNEMWGLGIDINRVKGIGDNATILTLTPVDGAVVDLRYVFLSPRARDGEGISRFGQGHVRDTIAQIEADFPIWEHKVHRANPALAKGEGAILAFRRWASRFYAPG